MNLATALRKKNELVAEIKKLEIRISEAMSYTSGNEIYTQTDYDKMCQDLQNLRHDLFDIKCNIDAANHKDQNGKCIYTLVMERGELKNELQYIHTLRLKVCNNRIRDWDEDSPELFHREDIKTLDSRIDSIETKLRKIEDDIATLNGSIKI
jgi:polyhydroxyalkanoate synthesis regulator phasin